MDSVKNFKDLLVWQKARLLVIEIYHLVKQLPKEETYGLSDQMRRASVSIPSNIAEGFGKTSSKDYIRFLSIALGSTYELETQLILCTDLGYLHKEDVAVSNDFCIEIEKMLNVMIKKIGARDTV